MKQAKLKQALKCAVEAAAKAGKLLRKNMGSEKKINSATQNDVKLELDVRCQKLIEKHVLNEFPGTAILGEEGVIGDESAQYRWVIDPIDGTVNYAHGIPHACVSIALQRAENLESMTSEGIVLGVVYDPFMDEVWTAIEGDAARLNGEKIHVSDRSELKESIVVAGFAKEGKNIEKNMALFSSIVPKVRKVRMMGSAALALTYVASGRFEIYAESGLKLWDIAAGKLILECAGGHYWDAPFGEGSFHVLATNQKVRKKAENVMRAAWKL